MPPFQANNAFYYYDDLPTAANFYQAVLGFRLVADYGFAQILQIAQSSFLTLVDSAHGMHTTDEPKTVTLALITPEVEAWYDYLLTHSVTIQHEISSQAGKAHDGFVALDPEGYFLEFEHFNPHPENQRLLPRLAQLSPLSPEPAQQTMRPAQLTIIATVLWLYYQDLGQSQRFYEAVFGLKLLVDQGFAKVYPTSTSGFIGLVQAGDGLHPHTDEKAVTVSLWTDDLVGWLSRLQAQPDFRLRTNQISTKDPRFQALVGYDLAGYFVELNTFLDHADNRLLLAQIP